MEYVEETTKKEENDVKRTKLADVEGEMMETRPEALSRFVPGGSAEEQTAEE